MNLAVCSSYCDRQEKGCIPTLFNTSISRKEQYLVTLARAIILHDLEFASSPVYSTNGKPSISFSESAIVRNTPFARNSGQDIK